MVRNRRQGADPGPVGDPGHAQYLRGKNKPTFTPHMDMGDFVVVINAEQVVVTGAKVDRQKLLQPLRATWEASRPCLSTK